MNSHLKSDEIDIQDLIINLIQFLKKNIIWVIAFPLLGLVGAYVYNMYKGPIFKASLLLRSSVMVEDELKFIMENYHLDYNTPGLSSEETRHIKTLSISTFKKDLTAYCLVECFVTDIAILPKMQAGIKNKLEHDPHVAYSVNNARDLANIMVNEYTASIKQAEALAKQPDNLTSGNYKNLNTLPEIMELYDKREQLIIGRRDSTGIQIVSGFQPLKVTSTTAKRLSIGLIGGIMACVAFLVIVYLTSVLKQASAEKS